MDPAAGPGERITESLAGRAAVLRLLPLSRREAEGRSDAPLAWEAGRGGQAAAAASRSLDPLDLWRGFLRGGYPELVANPGRDVHLWHASYVQTYLERDVRNLRQVGDLSTFQAFLRALAARSAQLLNLSELARDIGVAVNTPRAWLRVLEATYQVIVLRPYHENLGKRLVKTPKVYFTDVGTLSYLVGLRDPRRAAEGPMAGPIFETAVVVEVVKTLVHRGLEPQVYFWRTASGEEVDLLVEREGRLVPVEVKVSATPRPQMAGPIRAFQERLAARLGAPGSLWRPGKGYVVHPGELCVPLAPGVTAVPFRKL